MMNLILSNLADLARILVWMALWGLGGVWLVRSAFNLRPEEQALVGFGSGLVLQTWFANLVGHFLTVPLAFWLAAGGVLLVGLGFSIADLRRDWRLVYRIPVRPGQWLVLLALGYILVVVGQGLAILDDYQNLPVTSILATGDIPPHFPLDPKVLFNYHYFTLLFTSELMRIGGLHPWNSLDIVRGLCLALSVMIGALWVKRATQSTLAGLVSVLMGLFSGGARWMLLLLPESFLRRIAPSIQMIGSGQATAPDFFSALTSPWAVDSGAVWPFPFAYANGINTPSIWTYHSGAGAMGGIIGSTLLLTHNRWRGWRGGVVTAILLAALTLIAETSLARLVSGFAVLTLLYLVLRKRLAARGGRLHLPGSLGRWWVVLIPTVLIAAIQGGVVTGLVSGLVSRLSGQAAENSYFTLGFKLFWPPAFLSSHLGYLSFANFYQVIVALFEIGPVILLLPLPLIWGVKAFRAGRWYEAALIVMPVLSLVTLVIQYTGSAGPTALNRVQSQLIGLSSGGIAMAAVWRWGSRRVEWIKAVVGGLLFLSMFGGIVLFGIELLSAPRPIYSTFIGILDARFERDYWNKLEKDALIFDPIAWRAPTVFGRFTDSYKTWYEPKPEWEKLVADPSPAALRAYGYDYIYWDFKYWDRLKPEVQQRFTDACVRLVKQEEWKETPYDFRRLLDIRSCPAIQANLP